MLLCMHVTRVLFLVLAGNSALTMGFYWIWITHSYSSGPFLCALGWVCRYSHSRNKAVASYLEVVWPKSRGGTVVLSPDPTLSPGGTHRLDTRLVVSVHSSKSVWGHAPPGKLNTGKMLLKTFLSILSAILGKQTFHTWYASTLWGSYHRLFVTYSTHSSYKWTVSVGVLRDCFLLLYVSWQARLWFNRLWPHGDRFSDIADSRFKHGCMYVIDLAAV